MPKRQLKTVKTLKSLKEVSSRFAETHFTNPEKVEKYIV